jgi:hypothetical protein
MVIERLNLAVKGCRSKAFPPKHLFHLVRKRFL